MLAVCRDYFHFGGVKVRPNRSVAGPASDLPGSYVHPTVRPSRFDGLHIELATLELEGMPIEPRPSIASGVRCTLNSGSVSPILRSTTTQFTICQRRMLVSAPVPLFNYTHQPPTKQHAIHFSGHPR